MRYRTFTPILPAICCVLLPIMLACEDLSEFGTNSKEVFQGRIVGGGNGASSKSSFIRSGFQSDLTMQLKFDPDESEKSPGKISMFDEEGNTVWFSKTRLDPIDPLFHDPLTQYTFPGAGRIRNYIFGVRVAGQPRSALFFISLMQDGTVEVRIIAPTVVASDGGVESVNGETLSLLFGVFRLEKEKANLR
jgi:hypothetical protein